MKRAELSALLRERRLAQGIKHAALAQRLKTTKQYVCGLEGGYRRPSLPMLERWAHQLGCELALVDRP